LTTDTGSDLNLPFLYLALPVMDEPVFLPRLLKCLSGQSYKRFGLFVCVNQPDQWWNDPAKARACINNRASISLLKEFSGIDTVIIDRSSKGHGWKGKHHGIGYARKTIMDRISEVAGPGDIIVSLDADTVIPENYLRSLALNFRHHPDAAALSVPYFHRTPGDPAAARAILRYEIYMRHYFLNLSRIGSPYAFTALGSAMAVPVRAYRAIGGMTPKLSGEDFYFLQKLRKYGQVLLWNDEMVFPEARFSDRVFFGTGPAMIRGATGDWTSYPVYPVALFDEIAETYWMLPELFTRSHDTKVIRFMSTAFREHDPVAPLRSNHRDLDHFIRAFHEKFDGLRILQYLKNGIEAHPSRDEDNLWDFLERFYPVGGQGEPDIDRESFSFSGSPVELLEKLRMFLFDKERGYRATSAQR